MGCTMKVRGEISVFAALLFVVVLGLFMALFQSAQVYLRRGDAERAARASVMSLLAGYCRPLKDEYQMLALDGGYGSSQFREAALESTLENTFKANYGQGQVTMDEPQFVMLIGADWELFLREITIGRMTNLASDGLEGLIGLWRGNLDAQSADLMGQMAADGGVTVNEANAQAVAQREEVQALNGEVFEDEQTPAEKIHDPREGVTQIWNQGVLAAACPGDFSVSAKSAQMTNLSYPVAQSFFQTAIDLNDERQLQSDMSQWEDVIAPGGDIVTNVEDLAVMYYISGMFKNASVMNQKVPEHRRVLDYEQEYLITGKTNDADCLTGVLERLIALRFVMNMAHLKTSPAKQQAAGESGALLATALMIPEFAPAVTMLIDSAWALGESMSDCRCLLKGGKIPMIKSEDTWYLSWDNLQMISGSLLDGNNCQSGLTYADYLKLLMLAMPKEKRYKRMTHLMECNIRLVEGYEGFRMDRLVYGVQAAFTCSPGLGSTWKVQSAMSY